MLGPCTLKTEALFVPGCDVTSRKVPIYILHILRCPEIVPAVSTQLLASQGTEQLEAAGTQRERELAGFS